MLLLSPFYSTFSSFNFQLFSRSNVTRCCWLPWWSDWSTAEHWAFKRRVRNANTRTMKVKSTGRRAEKLHAKKCETLDLKDVRAAFLTIKLHRSESTRENWRWMTFLINYFQPLLPRSLPMNFSQPAADSGNDTCFLWAARTREPRFAKLCSSHSQWKKWPQHHSIAASFQSKKALGFNGIAIRSFLVWLAFCWLSLSPSPKAFYGRVPSTEGERADGGNMAMSAGRRPKTGRRVVWGHIQTGSVDA